MRNVLLIVLITLISQVSFSQSFDEFLGDADLFFKSHVENGKVNYKNIAENREDLNKLVSYIANADLGKLSSQEQKTFFINTYNILVINQIIENYPITSPMKISGFFKLNKHVIAGEKWTLDYLENKVLRKDFFNPELHFVLVCGALSCPQIAEYAYKTKNVEALMKSRANMALNNNNFVYEKDGTNYISEIFSWFKEDFGNEIEFINKYRVDKLDPKKPLKYYTYDWTLNDTDLNNGVEGDILNSIQIYNQGSLLKKGQIDLTLFNSIYTQNKQANSEGKMFDSDRQTFASSLIQFTYGSSENARLNIGMDINLRANGGDSIRKFSQLLKPLSFENTSNSRFGIASIAPKIKVSPFSKLNNFSVQSSFIIVLPKSPEGSENLSWLEWDRHIWWNQFFYTKSFSRDRFQLFLEGDLLFRFGRNPKEQGHHLSTPASVFLSYFPTKKITLYAMTQHTQRFGNDNSADWISANFTASGLGGKYQLNSFLILEALYTNFWRAQNNGLGETFNLGIKYIR